MIAPYPRVLVVDDDEAIRQMLLAVLTKEGLNVLTTAQKRFRGSPNSGRRWC